jgi:hypothetical protein
MSDGSLDGKTIGEIGVAVAVQRLLMAGYSVAVPLVDHGYDLLAYCGSRVWRIQVKSTAGHRMRVSLRCGVRCRRRYSALNVDAVVGVHVGRSLAVCVPMRAVAGRSYLAFSKARKYEDFRSLWSIKPMR